MADSPPNACQTRTRNQITPPLLHAAEDYWFKEFYLGLKVSRTESFIKTIEGQVHEFKQTGVNLAWNVSYINVIIPAWMVAPVYHSLRRGLRPGDLPCSRPWLPTRRCDVDVCGLNNALSELLCALYSLMIT